MCKKEPPSIYLFRAWLEDAMEAGPLVLAHHMNLHAREAFAEFSWEYLLDKIYIPWQICVGYLARIQQCY
jgi:hypothetical protein